MNTTVIKTNAIVEGGLNIYYYVFQGGNISYLNFLHPDYTRNDTSPTYEIRVYNDELIKNTYSSSDTLTLEDTIVEGSNTVKIYSYTPLTTRGNGCLEMVNNTVTRVMVKDVPNTRVSSGSSSFQDYQSLIIHFDNRAYDYSGVTFRAQRPNTTTYFKRCFIADQYHFNSKCNISDILTYISKVNSFSISTSNIRGDFSVIGEVLRTDVLCEGAHLYCGGRMSISSPDRFDVDVFINSLLGRGVRRYCMQILHTNSAPGVVHKHTINKESEDFIIDANGEVHWYNNATSFGNAVDSFIANEDSEVVNP